MFNSLLTVSIDQCAIIYPTRPKTTHISLLRTTGFWQDLISCTTFRPELHRQGLLLREKVSTYPLRLGQPLEFIITYRQLSLDDVRSTEHQLQGTRNLDDYKLTYLINPVAPSQIVWKESG